MKFEVSAAWMKACGAGDKARVFDIIGTEHVSIGRHGFDDFYTLYRDGYPWTVAAARGRLVEDDRSGRIAETKLTDGSSVFEVIIVADGHRITLHTVDEAAALAIKEGVLDVDVSEL